MVGVVRVDSVARYTRRLRVYTGGDTDDAASSHSLFQRTRHCIASHRIATPRHHSSDPRYIMRLLIFFLMSTPSPHVSPPLTATLAPHVRATFATPLPKLYCAATTSSTTTSSATTSSAPISAAAASGQGLTRVHFFAPRKRLLWDVGCTWGGFRESLRGAWEVLEGITGYLRRILCQQRLNLSWKVDECKPLPPAPPQASSAPTPLPSGPSRHRYCSHHVTECHLNREMRVHNAGR